VFLKLSQGITEYTKRRKSMTVVDLAKAHLQNVAQRIEELTKQQGLIQNEIDQLKAYVQNGIKDVQVFEESNSNEEGD
jgi:predicted transcriptional regulator